MDENVKEIPALYLIPSTMSDAPVDTVIPAGNIEIIRSLKYFVVRSLSVVTVRLILIHSPL